GQAHGVGAGTQVGVSEARRGRIGGRAIAKVPEAIGDRAGRIVGESDGEWLETAGGGAHEAGGGRQGPGAEQGIGAIAAATGDEDHITEAAGGAWRKAHDEVSGAKSRQAEWSAGKKAER